MVVPLFENIKNREAKRRVFDSEHQPWTEDHLGYRIFIVPPKNINLLRLNFPVPDTHEQYETAVSLRSLFPA